MRLSGLLPNHALLDQGGPTARRRWPGVSVPGLALAARPGRTPSYSQTVRRTKRLTTWQFRCCAVSSSAAHQCPGHGRGVTAASSSPVIATRSMSRRLLGIQGAQVGGEVAGGGQGIRVIFTQYLAAADQSVLIQVAGGLDLA